mgnify:CR=1 FL=1
MGWVNPRGPMQLVGADWQLGVELARSSFMTGSDACPAPLLGSFLRVGFLERSGKKDAFEPSLWQECISGFGRKAIFFYFFSMPTSSLDFLIHIFCGLVPAGCAAASVTWGWVVIASAGVVISILWAMVIFVGGWLYVEDLAVWAATVWLLHPPGWSAPTRGFPSSRRVLPQFRISLYSHFGCFWCDRCRLRVRCCSASVGLSLASCFSGLAT